MDELQGYLSMSLRGLFIKALGEKYREFIHVNMVYLIHDRTGDVKGFKQSWGRLRFPYPKIKPPFRIPLAYHEWRFFVFPP